MAAKPEQLRRRESGERAVAGEHDQPLESDAPFDLCTLCGGGLVVPEDRRAQHRFVLVEADEPVHLAGETNCVRRRQPLEDAPRRPNPVVGILLGPAGLRRRERVRLLGNCENIAVRRDYSSLDAGRPDVEPDERVYVFSRAPASQRINRRSRLSSSTVSGDPISGIGGGGGGGCDFVVIASAKDTSSGNEQEEDLGDKRA